MKKTFSIFPLKEHYRIGFANKTVAGSVSTTYVGLHKLTNLYSVQYTSLRLIGHPGHKNMVKNR